jgi:hypothetical protein
MRKVRILLLLIAFALPAVFAPHACASYDSLASGTTRLSLDKGFLHLMTEHGVRLSATAGAGLRAGKVTFPVSGGKFDPLEGKGTAEHEGRLVLRAGGRQIALGELLLRTTQKHEPFSLKIGGGQLKLAEAGRIAVARRGFGSTVAVSSMRLSAKVATRLGKKLRLRNVFEPGQPLGSSITRVSPQSVAIVGKGRVSLDLDPAFLEKLQGLFVAVNPIFPAEHPGPFTFPIFDGTLATDLSSGRLGIEGALEFLQLGGGQVFWRDPDLDFGAASLGAEVEILPSPPYGGKLGFVPIAALGRGAVAADPKARSVSLSGAVLALGAPMAATFEEVFAKPQGREGVFSAGEAIGTLRFSAQAE